MRRLILCLVMLATASPAAAYDKAGHFFSVANMLVRAMPNHLDAAHVAAFCVQLPDEAREIDAAAQARTAAWQEPAAFTRWLRRGDWNNPAIQRMALVQTLLHVLNGTADIQQLQDEALALVKKLAEMAKGALGKPNQNAALCAMGLAIHAYGDSFAHVDMADGGKKMYGTGLGHFKHMHYPDYPLCEGLNGFFALNRHCTVAPIAQGSQDRRAAGWSRYHDQLQETVHAAFDRDAPLNKATGAYVGTFKGKACANDLDKWCETEIRNAARDEVPLLPGNEKLRALGEALADHKVSTCSSAMDIGWKSTDVEPLTGQPPSCPEVFETFRAFALDKLAAFASDPAIPKDTLAKFPLPVFE